MLRAPLQSLATIVLAGSIHCSAAEATTLQLCNSTKSAVEFALGFSERGSPFITKGWWTAPAGKCSDPVPRGSKGIYYLHIKKVGGGSIEFGAGSKPVNICASLSTFTDRISDHRTDGKVDCAAGGLMKLKFVKFEMSRSDLPDVLTLGTDGAIKVSNVMAQPPKAGERGASAPAMQTESAPEPPAKRPPSPPPPSASPQPSDKPAAKSQTPEACKRYPNLC